MRARGLPRKSPLDSRPRVRVHRVRAGFRRVLLLPRGEKVAEGRMRGFSRDPESTPHSRSRTNLQVRPHEPGPFALTPTLSHSDAGAAHRTSFCGRGGTRGGAAELVAERIHRPPRGGWGLLWSGSRIPAGRFHQPADAGRSPGTRGGAACTWSTASSAVFPGGVATDTRSWAEIGDWKSARRSEEHATQLVIAQNDDFTWCCQDDRAHRPRALQRDH